VATLEIPTIASAEDHGRDYQQLKQGNMVMQTHSQASKSSRLIDDLTQQLLTPEKI
jgi:hypothetical protein